MYKLIDINKKKDFNDFVENLNLEFYSFLQSWEWWEVQEKLGKKVLRKGIVVNTKQPHPPSSLKLQRASNSLRRGSRTDLLKDYKLIWVLQIIVVKAKRGNYLFVPHWPLVWGDFFDVLSWILDNLKIIAKENNCCFIRFNSTVKNTIKNKDNFKKLWFNDAPMHEHAEDTHLLDLTIPEEQLLSNIKKKDRYYINRAIKEWVEVLIDNKKDHIEQLIKMHTQHAHRNNGKNTYSAFSPEFIYSLYDAFWDNISTISTSYNWNIESILMTIKFWKTCVYYIAASDIKNKKFSPNYLCQWEAIKKAKADWAKFYNFWWVSPDDNPKHPIAWVTKFKRKFAWYDYSLLHAQDLPLSYKYYFDWIIETFRRIKRGYYYKKPE